MAKGAGHDGYDTDIVRKRLSAVRLANRTGTKHFRPSHVLHTQGTDCGLCTYLRQWSSSVRPYLSRWSYSAYHSRSDAQSIDQQVVPSRANNSHTARESPSGGCDRHQTRPSVPGPRWLCAGRRARPSTEYTVSPAAAAGRSRNAASFPLPATCYCPPRPRKRMREARRGQRQWHPVCAAVNSYPVSCYLSTHAV